MEVTLQDDRISCNLPPRWNLAHELHFQMLQPLSLRPRVCTGVRHRYGAQKLAISKA